MTVAKKMCLSCPFRGVGGEEKRKMAVVPADEWSCHTEDPLGHYDIQCRGHYAARKRYAPTESDLAKLLAWREEANRKLLADLGL